jgi:hypothetical protein
MRLLASLREVEKDFQGGRQPLLEQPLERPLEHPDLFWDTHPKEEV